MGSANFDSVCPVLLGTHPQAAVIHRLGDASDIHLRCSVRGVEYARRSALTKRRANRAVTETGHVAAVPRYMVCVVVVAGEHPLAERLGDRSVEWVECSCVLQLVRRLSVPA